LRPTSRPVPPTLDSLRLTAPEDARDFYTAEFRDEEEQRHTKGQQLLNKLAMHLDDAHTLEDYQAQIYASLNNDLTHSMVTQYWEAKTKVEQAAKRALYHHRAMDDAWKLAAHEIDKLHFKCRDLLQAGGLELIEAVMNRPAE
jgi:hypothetical protein